MTRSAEVCLGVIVAIAIIAISYTAWRRWRIPKPLKITYRTPASPELVKASENLTIVLESILAIGKQFEVTDVDDETDMVIVETHDSRAQRAAESNPSFVLVEDDGLPSLDTVCDTPPVVKSEILPLLCSQNKYPPEIQASIRSVTMPATRIVENLKSSTPTYANIHAVYRGLCDADGMYVRVAEVYIAKGRSIKCTPLINVGKQLQQLVRSIHELGSALNLE